MKKVIYNPIVKILTTYTLVVVLIYVYNACVCAYYRLYNAYGFVTCLEHV